MGEECILDFECMELGHSICLFNDLVTRVTTEPEVDPQFLMYVIATCVYIVLIYLSDRCALDKRFVLFLIMYPCL